MDDLVRWLGEQLDEDERIARAATPGPWANVAPDGAHGWSIGVVPHHPGVGIAHLPGRAEAAADAAHIARHDPARVLREIDAKRQLLDELLPASTEPATDAELHARRAHPGYEYRTTKGPRKQWDDVDVPPVDEEGEPEPGWERNIDAGRDGWDRFDYTEESYWRRRLPEGREREPYVPRWLRLLSVPYADRPGYREERRP